MFRGLQTLLGEEALSVYLSLFVLREATWVASGEEQLHAADALQPHPQDLAAEQAGCVSTGEPHAGRLRPFLNTVCILLQCHVPNVSPSGSSPLKSRPTGHVAAYMEQLVLQHLFLHEASEPWLPGS